MRLIEHPAHFKTGTRVLLLRGRPKDGLPRNSARAAVAHGPDHFDAALADLTRLAAPGERIYATAGERDLGKAIRLLKERQLAAEYDHDPHEFYRELGARWESALLAPTSQGEKLWLFDCDTIEDTRAVEMELNRLGADGTLAVYRYASKSGTHFLTSTFDKSRLSVNVVNLIHVNPLMLWGY